MRKRIKRAAEKIMSVSGRKVVRYCFAAAFFCTLTACGSKANTATGYDARIVEPRDTDVQVWINYVQTYGIQNDTAAAKIKACEQVLNECVEARILDANGVAAYKRISQAPSVAQYVELISECEQEDNFYDTVGEGDAWYDYCDLVLNQCCTD